MLNFKANTLSKISKLASLLILGVASIRITLGYPVDMIALVMGTGAMMAVFLPVDISKIKTS
jgi:hypothetical protein